MHWQPTCPMAQGTVRSGLRWQPGVCSYELLMPRAQFLVRALCGLGNNPVGDQASTFGVGGDSRKVTRWNLR
jgi:hypothetical protein